MPDQIPAACDGIQANINNLKADVAELQLELRIDADINKVLVQNQITRLQQQITQAESDLATCITDNTPHDPPPPVIPPECMYIQTKIDQLAADRAELEFEAIHDPDINQALIAKAIRGLDNDILGLETDLGNCITSKPPLPPPATRPVINPDTTNQTVQKVIPWSFLQKKVDEVINNRTDPALFKFRFNYHHAVNSNGDPLVPPPSDLTISMLEAQVVNGQVTTDYKSLKVFDLDQLDHGFYFVDINSQVMRLEITPAATEPLKLTIIFETQGPPEAPNPSIFIPGQDFLGFDMSVKLSLEHVGLGIDCLAWVDRIASLKDDDFDSALTQFVTVHINTGADWDLGGAFQKAMRGKLFDKLKDPANRLLLNSMVKRWLLGGKGAYDVTSMVKDSQNITLTYQVPANQLDPFPDSTFRPAGWPYHGNPTPTIALPVSNSLSNIKHIVVLTMENRSFDHMLGYLSLPVSAGGMGRMDVDGLKGTEFNSFDGVNGPGFAFAVGDTAFPLDPEHSYEPVFRQINASVDAAGNAIPGTGKMDGFVKSMVIDKSAGGFSSQIMGHHPPENVPVYDVLTRDFGISHRWFCSHPGPTFTNRFYELTGRLNLNTGLDNPALENTWEFSNSSTLTPVFNKTIFDYLTDYQKNFDAAATWKYYEHGYCFLRFFSKHTFDATNIFSADDPSHGFFADAKNGTLPAVSFIDPHYIELPPNANADGPVADIKAGQDLVQRVVEAVVTSPSFANTLLVITYDEHGGFFDHVPPPAATPFSNESPIKSYGVRVPAFFISPWVKSGSVFGHDADLSGQHLYFDHTSILKTIAARFMSKNPPYMGPRFAAANDLSPVLSTTFTRYQFLPFIGYNFTFNPSVSRLQVQPDAITTKGAVLIHNVHPGGPGQDFAIEIAVGGWSYIRVRASRLYLTVDIPANGNTTPPADGFGVRQDVKFGSVATGQDPKYQLWRMTPLGTTGAAKTQFVIINDFFPNKILQPLNLQSGTRVALVDKPATLTIANTWSITSPLLA